MCKNVKIMERQQHSEKNNKACIMIKIGIENEYGERTKKNLERMNLDTKEAEKNC